MKKIVLLAGIVLSFIACTRQDEVLPEQLVKTKEIIITATREKLETKTELQSGSNVYWCPGDSISLFFRNGDNGGSKFKAQNTEAVPIAEFKGTIDVVSGGGESSGGEYWFWGIYPYSTQNSCDGSSITTVIPHEQVGKAGTFASNTFITMARAKGLNLAFYNICTGVKFNLSRTDIKAVTFRGNKNEHIAGKVNVGWNDSGKPAIQSYVSGRKVITVTAPEGGTFASGTDYYIIFAPTLFEEGFTMTVITNDSKQGVFYYNNSREFKRSIFVNISNLNERVNAWADVGDAAVKEVTDEGGTIEVNIDSDVECHALIPEDAQSWISVATKTKSTQQTIGLVVQPNTGESRSATIIIHSVDGTIVLPYVIEQTTNHNYVLTTEREALISIYNALDGDNWKDGYNNNWLSDKPVGEWYGVEVDEDGFVTSLYLTAYGEIPSDLKALSHLKKLVTNYYSSNKNLEIPKIIFSLTQLEYLHLYGQFLNGTISSEIGNLTNLKHLEINDTKISGQIPESISQLTQLEYLDLQLNQLSGELPASMGNLTKLRHIMLRGNQFSGNIPESVQALPIWKYDWGRIISENYFNERTMNIPAPEISGITTDGELINIPNEQHSYSVLIQWSAQYDGYLISQIDALNQIFNKYSDNVSFVGLVCSHREQGLSSVKNYIQNHNIQWPSIYWESGTEVIKGQDPPVQSESFL